MELCIVSLLQKEEHFAASSSGVNASNTFTSRIILHSSFMSASSADKVHFQSYEQAFDTAGNGSSATIPLSPRTPRTSLEVSCADKNRPVRFCFAIKIFSARFQFDGLTVGHEYSELVLIVSLKVIVQGFSADGTPHAVFSVLSPKRDHSAVEIISLFPLRKTLDRVAQGTIAPASPRTRRTD